MKTGFVTLFGRSNVGKSTLLNRLVGTKVAITSPLAQTTRHAIQGVLHHADGQIVFIDTPGMFFGASGPLTAHLNKTATGSLEGVDAIVHVVDPTRPIGPEDRKLFTLLDGIQLPKILVINKIDVRPLPYLSSFEERTPSYQHVVEVSAKNGTHLDPLIHALLELLPDGEPLYPLGQVTNRDNTFWFAELIREKLFLRLKQELPYALTVKVDEVDRRRDGTLYLKARIITSSERYKGMVIGKGGRGVKEIGQSVRKELEAVTASPVYVDLTVEANPHWIKEAMSE